MAKNATRDLTVGSPMKLILSFMLPLLFGMLFQQFYSMVDTVVVGKFLGVDALADPPAPSILWFWVCATVSAPALPSLWPRNSVRRILRACVDLWET